MGTSTPSKVGPTGRTAFNYALWAIVAAPLTIVVHELGHFGMGLVLGTPDLALHYGSVSDSAAEMGFSPTRIGAQALAGPVVTLAIMAASFLALRRRTHPFVIALMIAAPVRFLVGAVYLFFLTQAALQGVPPGQPNFDEFKASQALGFPVAPLLILELALTLAAWVWGVRRLMGFGGYGALLGTLGGIVVGIMVWIVILGPRLLP